VAENQSSAFLIVGLGNPGPEYERTRHNIGFMAVDSISSFFGFPPFKERFTSEISSRELNDCRVILQKPHTFMNSSGSAVLRLVSDQKIETKNIFVVHDDLELPEFKVRIRFSGGHRGHNGLRSIDSSIGRDYWRIRIGIGRPLSKEEVSNYVMSSFCGEETLGKLRKTVELITKSIPSILSSDKKEIQSSA
jgi:PTH1 family peptidyl-tRNA hydrolase